MTVSIPSNVVEIKLDMVELKLDRLIDEMRFLKSHTIAFDRRLRGIEALSRNMTRDGAKKRRGVIAHARCRPMAG